MTLASLMLGAFLGFLAGVLTMSLLRVAAFDPPTLEPASELETQGSEAILTAQEKQVRSRHARDGQQLS
jgi:hypothetical protein